MRDVSPAGAQPPANLLAHLRHLTAVSDGFLPFGAFMREALYHPQFGYYSRQIPTVGRKGDFSTSVTLHGALGRAIAAWALTRCAVFPKFERWHLIELGAGGGQLALNVLDSLSWWQGRRVRYHIVERSEPLRSEQAARLAGRPGVRWHDGIESALREARGRAVIFSNEFADAFPCVALLWDGTGSWREIGVRWDENAGTLVETAQSWETPPDAAGSAIFDEAYTRGLALGQRVEWHREYQSWQQGWSGHWISGAMLTVDYGETMPALYRHRPAGTLRAYFRHMLCTGPEVYLRPGHQDLTADVNFSDLMRWGTALGWDNALCNQAEFLHRWLPPRYARKVRTDPAFRFLTDREGAGSAFQVLEHRPR